MGWQYRYRACGKEEGGDRIQTYLQFGCMAGLNNRLLCWFHGVVVKRLEMVSLIHLGPWRERGRGNYILRYCVIFGRPV